MRKLNITAASFLVVTHCLLFLHVSVAFGGVPTDRVKQSVDAILNIIKNPELKKPENQKVKRDKIRAEVNTIFDFHEMARRALATHWKERTPEEQQNFVSLFSDLLEDTYIRKVEKNYTNEKVVYAGEKITGANAVVKTKVISKTETETPIDYRLIKTGENWMVYDVVIEGVSLVNNYRSQFNQILTSGGWDDLIQKLKNRSLKEPVA